MGIPSLVVAVSAAALLAGSVVTARRPVRPVPDVDGYLARWVTLHGGYDVARGNPWLRGWLRMSYVVARPLARRGVQPSALTLWGSVLALGAVAAADAGGRWPLVAGLLLVLSGLGDTLDGCVAVLTDRVSRFGYVLDSVVDRVNDLLYLLAVALVGGSAGLAVVCGAGFLLLEYIRARGSNAGAGDLGTVTVGERASRVIVLALALVGAGALPERAGAVATAGLWVMALLTAVGLVQITVAVHRLLAGPTGAPGGSEPPPRR